MALRPRPELGGVDDWQWEEGEEEEEGGEEKEEETAERTEEGGGLGEAGED